MRPLPVITIVKEAALVVWRKRLGLFRTLAGAGLALALLDTAPGYFSMGRPGWAITTLYSAVNAIILTLFAITCYRIVLLDETATPRFGIHTWHGAARANCGLLSTFSIPVIHRHNP
jgi:hypothetical protein